MGALWMLLWAFLGEAAKKIADVAVGAWARARRRRRPWWHR